MPTATPAPKTIEISKNDATGGKSGEIEGAKIELYKVEDDGSGNKTETLVTSWTSGKTAKTVELQPGDYVLKETTPPDGFEAIKSNIEFTVKADGTVTTTSTEAKTEKM